MCVGVFYLLRSHCDEMGGGRVKMGDERESDDGR